VKYQLCQFSWVKTGTINIKYNELVTHSDRQLPVTINNVVAIILLTFASCFYLGQLCSIGQYTLITESLQRSTCFQLKLFKVKNLEMLHPLFFLVYGKKGKYPLSYWYIKSVIEWSNLRRTTTYELDFEDIFPLLKKCQ
jgi:hypothetical protein